MSAAKEVVSRIHNQFKARNRTACHNCGLPEGSLKNEGRVVQIVSRAANGFQRDRKVSVWICCDECAVQALGISKWGLATHKWPVTLAQFRATKPLEDQKTSITIPRQSATIAFKTPTAEMRP